MDVFRVIFGITMVSKNWVAVTGKGDIQSEARGAHYMTKPFRPLFFFSVMLAMVACSGTDKKPATGGFSQIEIDYQDRLAEVLCAEWFRCPSWVPREYASEAACVAQLRSVGVSDDEEFFRVTHSGGTFDPAAFERCMQQRLDRICGDVRMYSADCDTYLQGSRGLGSTCLFSSECADGWCDDSTCDVFTCVARLSEGATCGRDEQCVSGLVCSLATGTCAAEERFPGPGEACGPALACVAGHTCSTLEGPGTCVPLPQDGEPCANLLACGGGDWEGCRGTSGCALGSTCTFEDDGGTIVYVCRPLHYGVEGEYCRGVLNLCDGSQRLRCFNAMMSEYSDTCFEVPPAGAAAVWWQGACEPNDADHTCCWDDAYWEADLCRPKKRLGQPCASHRECFSEICEIEAGGSDSVCTLVYPCMVNNINNLNDVNHEE